MKLCRILTLVTSLSGFGAIGSAATEQNSMTFADSLATMTLTGDGELRSYQLSTKADLRDNQPADKQITFSEDLNHARCRTGNLAFDGLYALAIHEALQNSVSQISDGAYANGNPISIDAYQTGAKWTYVWTRDLAYSVHLGLAGFDPARAANSLFFKTSSLKPGIQGGYPNQMVQDTGSGGSYPVSTDRVVWVLGAREILNFLPKAKQDEFLRKVYPILCDTIEQDRCLVFDPSDGLYRGEHSFLDWREQTYPGWTAKNVMAIAMSKAVSVNAANYILLQTASEYAGLLKNRPAQVKYGQWAQALQTSINRNFFDEAAGLYRTYLLSDDGTHSIPADRYDVMGQSLAILSGVASVGRAERILEHYPVGPFGPPVVWPEERSVPIYHNQSVWPFATAYWLKSAKLACNTAAIELGIEALTRLAGANLSNMENYDFISGKAQVSQGPRQGPVINSQRQLWSVAGYLSMVQDVVFGLETSRDGIRFRPMITANLRNGMFGESDMIELANFSFRGTKNHVRLHLPAKGSFASGVCEVISLRLNGEIANDEFVAEEALHADNVWDITLVAVKNGKFSTSLNRVNVANENALFSPLQPEWNETPIIAADGLLTLHFRHAAAADVVFNIYRNGKLIAKNVATTNWTDPESKAFDKVVYDYSVAAVSNGRLASHPTPARSYRTKEQQQVIPASELVNQGGNFVGAHHFENWGKPDHSLESKVFKAALSGRHVIRAEFSNGAGPGNTGVTCAVKRIEVFQIPKAEPIAAGYLVMPHSGDWQRWDLSNAISVDLQKGESYRIRISEDPYSRNMSYFQSNERYSSGLGGGKESFNYVNIASLRILYLEPGPSR